MPDILENSYLSNRSSHFHDANSLHEIGWPDTSSFCTLVSVLVTEKSPPHKQLHKLSLYCRLYSENQLGNSKTYESNYDYSTAAIIETLPAAYEPIQTYSCHTGNGKNTKASDSVPHNCSDITNSVIAIPVYDKMPKQ